MKPRIDVRLIVISEEQPSPEYLRFWREAVRPYLQSPPKPAPKLPKTARKPKGGQN